MQHQPNPPPYPDCSSSTLTCSLPNPFTPSFDPNNPVNEKVDQQTSNHHYQPPILPFAGLTHSQDPSHSTRNFPPFAFDQLGQKFGNSSHNKNTSFSLTDSLLNKNHPTADSYPPPFTYPTQFNNHVGSLTTTKTDAFYESTSSSFKTDQRLTPPIEPIRSCPSKETNLYASVQQQPISSSLLCLTQLSSDGDSCADSDPFNNGSSQGVNGELEGSTSLTELRPTSGMLHHHLDRSSTRYLSNYNSSSLGQIPIDLFQPSINQRPPIDDVESTTIQLPGVVNSYTTNQAADTGTVATTTVVQFCHRTQDTLQLNTGRPVKRCMSWSPPVGVLPHLHQKNHLTCDTLNRPGTRRRNATRESTATLKTWLQEHIKNPYPTKGEKIMLAIITKMTLTQVSTWFANARRRLKKENKMTWTPKHRSDDQSDQGEDDEDEEEGDDLGDGESGLDKNGDQSTRSSDDTNESSCETDQGPSAKRRCLGPSTQSIDHNNMRGRNWLANHNNSDFFNPLPDYNRPNFAFDGANGFRPMPDHFNHPAMNLPLHGLIQYPHPYPLNPNDFALSHHTFNNVPPFVTEMNGRPPIQWPQPLDQFNHVQSNQQYAVASDEVGSSSADSLTTFKSSSNRRESAESLLMPDNNSPSHRTEVSIPSNSTHKLTHPFTSEQLQTFGADYNSFLPSSLSPPLNHSTLVDSNPLLHSPSLGRDDHSKSRLIGTDNGNMKPFNNLLLPISTISSSSSTAASRSNHIPSSVNDIRPDVRRFSTGCYSDLPIQTGKVERVSANVNHLSFTGPQTSHSFKLGPDHPTLPPDHHQTSGQQCWEQS